MGYFYNKPSARLTRRALRKNIPKPEEVLWYYLRARRFYGIKVRRQYSIGPYVVDFYCPEKRTAIEIDGDSHYETIDAIENDKIRQDYIEQLGIHFIRFTNQEVRENIDGVLKRLAALLRRG